MEKILLVIPCYNEKKRLPLEEIKSLNNDNVELIFVDDGSQDQTAQFIKKNLPYKVIKLEKNKGKAQAVREGILNVYSQSEYENFSWFGFWDADMSTSLDELPLIQEHIKKSPEIKSIWCSRVYKLGSKIERSLRRHMLGRVFAVYMHTLTGLDSYDSQCGAKLFHRSVITKVFQEPFISNWVFDVEIGIRMNGKNIEEYPVKRWIHKSGSKIKFFRDSIAIFVDLFKIRLKYGKLKR